MSRTRETVSGTPTNEGLIACGCRRGLLAFTLLFLNLGTPSAAARITVHFDPAIPQIGFAVEDLMEALHGGPDEIETNTLLSIGKAFRGSRIILTTAADSRVLGHFTDAGLTLGALQPEGFSIRRAENEGATSVWVVGADAAGAMYGGLELAETLRTEGFQGIQKLDRSPYMAMRGTKFNCPLDVRTPSYSDVSDSAQQNIAEMWSFDFWKDYIDLLARYRFNFVSLWNLHPFPSMIRVPEYPDVALDDVLRSAVKWKENYRLEGLGFDEPEILASTEILKRMTIDEKIDFWRRVMRYAKERNVDFYIVTWNIFVYGTRGLYGITDEIGNEVTRDYFRKSVRQLFLTYPDLAGIGLTTGENMPGATQAQKEEWAFSTYAAGVLEVLKEQPDRKIVFIHRQHQTGAPSIAAVFEPLVKHPGVDFLFSFKYAQAHVYSSTRQTFHPGFVREIRDAGNLSTIWTLRNDDVYHFRWGSPDFVREFLLNIPHDVSEGYYYGSDQYIWGREFLDLEPETPRELEISKHWYQWMLWGRLGYDPRIENERFVGILRARFPEVDADKLFEAWQQASSVYPLTTGFHWGALDFQWYIEACKSRPEPAQTASGFHDVNRFITLPPHPGTDNISIPDYVEAVYQEKELSGTTPLQVSSELHRHSDRALDLLKGLSGKSRELQKTFHDIRAMSLLGKYYAHKIRGATELALYRKGLGKEHQDAAVRELQDASRYWRRYTDTAAASYKNPLWTNRVGYVHWEQLTHEADRDIEIAAEKP